MAETEATESKQVNDLIRAVIGGLLGAIPGALLMAVGQVVTGGGEWMLPIGMFGVLLTFVGLLAGAIIGSRGTGWLTRGGALGAVVGLVPGLVIWRLSDTSLEVVALALIGGFLLGGFVGNRIGHLTR